MTTRTKAKADVQTGLPVYSGAVAAIDGDAAEMHEIIAENMGGDGLRPSDLTRVTFPREMAVWDVDGQPVQELRGIPLKQTKTRTFYFDEYQQGSNAQPDCSSADGIRGVPKDAERTYVVTPRGDEVTFGGNCMRCPLNQWDTAWNNKGEATPGKACREYQQVAFLPLDAPLPIILRIPPTQLRPWHDFCANVTKMRRRISETVASLTVNKDKDNRLFLQAAIVGVLPDETAGAVRALNTSMNLLAPVAVAALPEGVPPIEEYDLEPEPSDLPF